MTRKKQRTFEVFSLSFLDCICCGFGAVILLFVLVTGRGLRSQETQLSELSEEIAQAEEAIVLETEILEEKQALLTLKQQSAEASRAAEAIAAENTLLEEELEGLNKEFAAMKQAIAEQSQATEVAPVSRPQPAYLTDFNLSGQRVLFLVEASGGMLAETVSEALDQLSLPAGERLKSPKWVRVRDALKTLIAYLPEETDFQVRLFNSELHSLPQGQGSSWIAGSDRAKINTLIQELDTFVASGGANYERAFSQVSGLGADNIVLLTDGLPTKSDTLATSETVSQSQRVRMLTQAQAFLPRNTPIQIILFPMAGDPASAPYYWALSKQKKGSFMTPASSWPK